MWVLSVLEGELASQVADKQGLFLRGLDSGHDLLINIQLGSLSGIVHLILLFEKKNFFLIFKNKSTEVSDRLLTSFLTSKISASVVLAFFSLTRSKKASLTFSGRTTLLVSSLVLVAITYLALMRLIGQPLSLNGPVTSNRPESSCFRKTTR